MLGKETVWGAIPRALMRAVLDTNVIVSALLIRGTASRLLPPWQAGRLHLLATGRSLGELARVMSYPKFARSTAEVEAGTHTDPLRRGAIPRALASHPWSRVWGDGPR